MAFDSAFCREKISRSNAAHEEFLSASYVMDAEFDARTGGVMTAINGNFQITKH